MTAPAAPVLSALDALPGLRRDVALAPLVRWRIGGPADYFIEPDSAAALSRALIAARAAGKRRIPSNA